MLVWPHLRKIKHVLWLQGLISPVNVLYQQFRKNRDANLYRLKITGQVCYLQRLLNDRYDISDRRISIDDGQTFDPVYIFLELESKPVHLFTAAENQPVYIYTQPETAIDPADFVVKVPAGLVYNETEMRGLIDAYKLAGKIYTILQQ